MAILSTSHLKKYYGKGDSVKALDDVNVSMENGQFAAIIGTSVRNHRWLSAQSLSAGSLSMERQSFVKHACKYRSETL